MSTINKDLQRERKKCTFKPEELTHFLDGGIQKTIDRRESGDYFLFFFRKYIFSLSLSLNLECH